MNVGCRRGPLLPAAVCLALSAVILAGQATAGFPDLTDGWLHAPGGIAAGNDVAGGGSWVAAGQGLLYGLPELPQRYLALGVAGRNWSRTWRLRLDFQQSGQGLFEDAWCGGEMAVGGTRGLGLVFSRRSLLVAGRAGSVCKSAVMHGFVGVGGITSPGVRLDVYLPLWADAEADIPPPGHQRLLDLQLSQDNGSLCVRLARDRRDVPRLDCEVLWGDSAPLALTLRLQPGTGTVGPGIRLGRPGMLLMTSHLVHPVLGITHRLMVVLGRWQGCRL